MLVENYSNSRPRQTHRLTRQFLVAVRPTILENQSVSVLAKACLANGLLRSSSKFRRRISIIGVVSSRSRAKIDEVTLDALRTRQSLVKGERLVRHEMRAVLPVVLPLRGACKGWGQGVWDSNSHYTVNRPPHGVNATSACLVLGMCVFNLPGWRWATIKKVALDRLSRSLHSDVCDSDGCRDAVAHSRISGRGSRRSRAAPNNAYNKDNVALCLAVFVGFHFVFRSYSLTTEHRKKGCAVRIALLCTLSQNGYGDS